MIIFDQWCVYIEFRFYMRCRFWRRVEYLWVHLIPVFWLTPGQKGLSRNKHFTTLFISYKSFPIDPNEQPEEALF